MTTTAKERIKTEFQQAKAEGKQRSTRISDILKNAASLTFDEIKEGSSNLNVSARKSMAELLEELKEAPEASTDAMDETVVTEAATETAATDAVNAATDRAEAAPSWKTIVIHALEIVRDRKDDWLQNLKEYLAENAGKFDRDMTTEYGDRYQKVKQVFKSIINRVKAAQAGTRQTNDVDQETSQPVDIEVVDGDISTDSNSTESNTVRLIEPKP